MARYDIVPERSHVWIDARSSVHPIHTTTAGLEGFTELEIAPDGRVDLAVKPVARLSLAVELLRSGNRLEDREMRKRIDASRYPRIEGVLVAMEPADHGGSYQVRGEIAFRGVTRPHEDQMSIEALDDRTIRLAGKSSFDVRDFGMDPPRVLMLKVEPEVEVRVEILAVREEPGACTS
ncbi:MAG: YceI family protein [Acidimicrobiales bacterium]